MSDRQVGLNLSMPSRGAQTLQSGVGGESAAGRDAPDAEAQERFAAALSSTEEKLEEKLTPLPQPFSLCRTEVTSGLRNTPEPPSCQAELAAGLSAEVDRLMVADGSSGNRQVRMDLKDDLLPGVSVAIQENEGRLQVDFICSIESSRLKLNRALPELANTLAQRLRRDVLMRVQTDDDEDPCLQEALVTV